MSKLEFKPQDRQSIDFAEETRQKSKNMWAYGDVSGTQRVRIDLINPLPKGTYTMSGVATSNDTDETTCLVLFFDKNEKQLGGVSFTRGARSHGTLELSADAAIAYLYASGGMVNGAGDTFSITDIQIEKGTVATDYQPYNGAIVFEEYLKKVGNDKLLVSATSYSAFLSTDLVDGGLSNLMSEGMFNTREQKNVTIDENNNVVIGRAGLYFIEAHCCLTRSDTTSVNTYLVMYKTATSTRLIARTNNVAQNKTIQLHVSGIVWLSVGDKVRFEVNSDNANAKGWVNCINLTIKEI